MRERRVYFAVARDMVKIGCSINPEQRLAAVTEWVPYETKIVATIKGGYDLERALHNQFAADWSHMEWFHLTPRIAEFIARVADGLPVEIITDPNARDIGRRAAIRAKCSLTNRVHRAEARAHDTKNYLWLDSIRPARIQALFDSYSSPQKPPPTPEMVEIAEQYMAELASLKTGLAA